MATTATMAKTPDRNVHPSGRGRLHDQSSPDLFPVVGRPLGLLRVDDGALESLKWLGLVTMTLDHVNKYLLHDSSSTLFAIGRLTLPLFAFVLAYNLSRPSVLCRASLVFPRVLKRLAVGAILASVPFVGLGGLGGGWWPLNILATFFVAVAAMYSQLSGARWGTTTAVGVVVLGGGLVEYWWPAIGACLAAWHYCRKPSGWAAAAWLFATLALNLTGWAFGALPLVNDGMWALAAFPLILIAAHVQLRLPRLKWVFYAYYPAHLVAIWLLQWAR